MSTEKPFEGLADKILELNRKQREKFLKEVPPSSWIWENKEKQVRGLTIGNQRIYVDPSSGFVAVGFIQGDEKLSGVWEARNIVRLTQKEKRKSNL